MILYSPAEAIILVVLPPGPASLPVTITSMSTVAGSSRMVQVRVRGSPGQRSSLASGARLIARAGGGTVRCVQSRNVNIHTQKYVSLLTLHSECLSSHICSSSGGSLAGVISSMGR